MSTRPPIVNFLFPVICPHRNFRATCIFIITFGDHFIKIFVVTAMLLSVCVVISLRRCSVMVYYWNTSSNSRPGYELSDVVYHHKTRKVSTSSELQAANLLQVAIGEAQDTLMNTSPQYSICYKCIIMECGQSKRPARTMMCACFIHLYAQEYM